MSEQDTHKEELKAVRKKAGGGALEGELKTAREKLAEARSEHRAELDKAQEAQGKAEDELREARREQKHERQQAKEMENDLRRNEEALKLISQAVAGPAAGPP